MGVRNHISGVVANISHCMLLLLAGAMGWCDDVQQTDVDIFPDNLLSVSSIFVQLLASIIVQ